MTMMTAPAASDARRESTIQPRVPRGIVALAGVDERKLSDRDYVIFLAGYQAAWADARPELAAAEEFAIESCDAALALQDRLQRLESAALKCHCEDPYQDA